MQNLNRKILLAALGLFLQMPIYAKSKAEKDTLFQISTINALMEGIYDGNVTIGELRKKGDFGIGTFNGLDGEMIMLSGKTYRLGSDGNAHKVLDFVKTPYSAVTFLDCDKKVRITEELNFNQLEEYLNKLLPSKNIPYAIKIEGIFKYIKVRSVPKQAKPYPRLAEVIKTQPEFELYNIKGIIAGYRLPEYIKGINVPGYHFHFITEDRTAGGHVLKLNTKDVNIIIDDITVFEIRLPDEKEFNNVDLKCDDKEIESIMKDKEKN